jgi:hypothetical protein
MSIRGKWRITEMPDYEADYPDMMEPAYIQLWQVRRRVCLWLRERRDPRNDRRQLRRVHLVW